MMRRMADTTKFGTEHDRIERALTLHPPKDPAIGERLDRLREGAKAYAHLVDELCPNGRYKSLALTAIEEASMRAVGAVATDQDACLP